MLINFANEKWKLANSSSIKQVIEKLMQLSTAVRKLEMTTVGSFVSVLRRGRGPSMVRKLVF